MGLKKLFAKEIYVRFNKAEDGFICTVQAGGFRIKSQEFLLEGVPVEGPRERRNAPTPAEDSAARAGE